MGAKNVKQYLKNAMANVSSIIFGSASDKSLSEEIECTEIDSLDTQDWSKDNECNETVILRKSDYEKICSELSLARIQTNNYRIKEKEYKKDIEEMNNTLSYFLTKGDENRTIILEDLKNRQREGSICLENDINRLRAAEQRLKAHIKALQRDLFEAESKAESFKEMAFEEINKLKEETELLKKELEDAKTYGKKILVSKERAEDTAERRSEECLELVEYCKLLLNKSKLD